MANSVQAAVNQGFGITPAQPAAGSPVNAPGNTASTGNIMMDYLRDILGRQQIAIPSLPGFDQSMGFGNSASGPGGGSTGGAAPVNPMVALLKSWLTPQNTNAPSGGGATAEHPIMTLLRSLFVPQNSGTGGGGTAGGGIIDNSLSNNFKGFSS